MATTYTFTYTVTDLLKRINREVLYKTSNRDDKPGVGNNSTIDADNLIKDYLSSIASEIFDKWVSSLSRGVELLDDPLEPYSFDPDGDIVFNILLVPNFDTNNIPVILRSIEDTMVSYAIYQWMMDRNLKGWEKYEQEHLRKMNNLSGLVTRRTVIKRPYKLY